MRKTIVLAAALAFAATAAVPAFAGTQHAKKQIPSITDIVTQYAT